MTIDEQIAALIAAAVKPLQDNAQATTAAMQELRTELAALRELVSQQPPPAPAPEPSPPPAPAPEPQPEPPPAPVDRTRAEVQRILLEEFAKQTSFIPGGNVNDPNGAIQLWVTAMFNEEQAATRPESELRARMAARIAVDVKKYGWDKNYPPKPPSGPVISGTANLPK